MRVLIVLRTLDPKIGGGTTERTFHLCRELVRKGVNVNLITLDLGLDEERRQALSGVNILALPCLWKRFYFPKFLLSKIRAFVLLSDVVHFVGHWSVLNLLVWREARKYEVPFLLNPAGEFKIVGRSRPLKQLFDFFFGQRMKEEAKGYLAVTAQEKEEFTQQGLNPLRCDIVPNGVDPEQFNTQPTCDLYQKYHLPRKPYLFFMGRLEPIKGPDLLLEAFVQIANDFSEIQLVYGGADNGLLSTLQRKAKEPGLQGRVHFPGLIAYDDRETVYRAAEAVVIPSRREMMSLVVLEAGLCRRPVLLTSTCGFEALEEAEAGWTVEPTVEGLAAGLQALLASAEEQALRAERLEQLVLAEYTWEVIGQRHLEIYSRLLSKSDANLEISENESDNLTQINKSAA
ncbi:Glycosyltransferase involved in cell wall bisynthesis [Planctomycetales bacterium 10988]|nr:Glycosyltransferase involved in cell wall bisynthesis [Planctomycetales bacterium 10988]